MGSIGNTRALAVLLPVKDEVLTLVGGVAGCAGSDRARPRGAGDDLPVDDWRSSSHEQIVTIKIASQASKLVNPCISTNVTPKTAIPSGGSVAHVSFELPDAQRSYAAPGSTSSQT